MRQRLRTALLLLSCVVSLTACGWMGVATREPTVLTKPILLDQPLSALPTCPPRPLPPGPDATQRDVAAYVRELSAWGEACEAKVAEVAQLLRPTDTKPDAAVEQPGSSSGP